VIIRKVCATVKTYQAIWTRFAAIVCCCFACLGPAFAQDPAAADPAAADAAQANPAEAPADPAASDAQSATKQVSVPTPIDSADASVTYPRALSLHDGKLLIVDLDLPGIWIREGDSTSVYTPGTKLLRKPMNRPWCVAPHPGGGILIGDSATREIYHAAKPGVQLTALNNGYLGIPMAIAVDPSGETLYVGDAERRAVFSMPIGGGKPELVVRVNARGLSFDQDGNLWAVTPDADAIQRIDVEAREAEVVVGNRPYQFPTSLVWSGEEGFVTDVYGKAIWSFTADGKTEKWFEGAPLERPVGITADENAIYVADPAKQQVLRFDRKTKAVEPVME
jgi:sugar lactone lactonase YvrE